MKPKEKRKLLVELIEILVANGYDIAPFVGKPLSYFNYDYIQERIKDLKIKNN